MNIAGVEVDDGELDRVIRQELFARLVEAWGDVRGIRERMRARTLCREELRVVAEGMLQLLLDDTAEFEFYKQAELQSRLIDLALDQLESEALAPPLRLRNIARQLTTVPVHALIFNAFPLVTHELYPLMVDAFTAGKLTVVGVHERWLVGDAFRRAIFLDEDTLDLVEADVLDAPAISSAQVLALDLREEHGAHRRIESRLTTSWWNSAVGAEKLDDKNWTGVCWQNAGLDTPRFVTLCAKHSDAELQALIAEITESSQSLILKPIDATEGRGVRRIFADSTEAFAVIRHQLSSGMWMLMEERGTVCCATTAGAVPFVLRINVFWDVNAAFAESSYAQVAASSTGIASVGQGGRIVSTSVLWKQLCDAKGNSYHPHNADWHRIVDIAQSGVRILALELGTYMPALVGVDMLLDFTNDGELTPVLLEANGRPAGLGHSRLLAVDAPGEEPGVSVKLWISAR